MKVVVTRLQSEISDEDTHVVPKTPVKSALSSVSRLKALLEIATDSCTDCLKLRNCSETDSKEIYKLTCELRIGFMKNYMETMGTSHRTIADGRFNMARTLMYRVLNTLLTDSNCQSEIEVILHNAIFLKSLLACSLEVVLSTYNDRKSTFMSPGNSCSPLAFPWILNVFNLKAYDFYKIIAQLVKAEPKLDDERVKHLVRLEEQILAYYVWQEDSTLWDVFKTALDYGVTGSNESDFDDKVSSLSDNQMETSIDSPAREQSPVTCQHVSSLGQIKSAPEVEQLPGFLKQIPQSLNYFYNKVSKVAYNRIRDLCTKLDISSNLMRTIWRCVENVIMQRPDLLSNRHLDQMILCAVYGVCKVSDEERKFRTIVSVYKDLPYASSKVFRSVLIDGNVHESIIVFYNRVFMPCMKGYLCRLLQQRETTVTEECSTNVSDQSRTGSSETYALPGCKNFYISPLRKRPSSSGSRTNTDSPGRDVFKVPLTPSRMTPRTKKLYSFGERLGSSEVLHSINEAMGTMQRIHLQPQIPRRSHKRLKFDNEMSNTQEIEVELWPTDLNLVPPGGDQENKK